MTPLSLHGNPSFTRHGAPAGTLVVLPPRRYDFCAPAASRSAVPPMNEDVICDLVEAVAQARDKDAFSRLFRHFAPRLASFAQRRGSDAAAAQDLAQDAMLTVWRKAPQFDRNRATASAWIYAIARNRRIDVLRREKRPDPDTLIFMHENTAPSAEGEVERHMVQDRLRATLDQVPPGQLEILKKAYFEELSHSDIAKQMNLPLGTVKSRIRLALIRLRGLMDEEQP